MLPVPADIKIVEEFGEETVVDSEDGKPVATGTVMFLSGEPAAFVRWLKPFDGVWRSNHPMSGTWRVSHIKENAGGDEEE